MITTNIFLESLGTEPKEILGFETDEELEIVLQGLMLERKD